MVYAAAAWADGEAAHVAARASHAWLAATQTATAAAEAALQVHGAMGYSWEVDLHFFMKRAWVLAGTWGDHNYHARRVQSLLFSGELALGPAVTMAPASPASIGSPQ